MRSLRFHQFGGPEVLQFDEDAPVPEPGEREIQVQVSGAGVNAVDWKLREGYLQAYFPLTLPATVGWEFSGTVSKLGPGVSQFNVGDEVYGHSHHGTTAEYTLASVDGVALKPFSMDLPDAGGVPLAGTTAYQALIETASLKAGQRVLIQGGSGGVGTFAIQFAKWKGAYVIATASKKNHHLLQELGCDELIDYRAVSFDTVVKDVDVVLEAVGGDENMRKSISVLKPGGILVSITSDELASEAEAQGKRSVHHFMHASADHLKVIADLIQDLQVRPVVDAVVPYAEAVEAQKESQAGHVVGKLVVDVRR